MLISHATFAELRLAQFVASSDIEELTNWEYMERLWVGESIGFSEWLRLEDEPDVLRALSLDFQDFPQDAADRVLDALKLAVHAGMGIDDLRGVLGSERQTLRFSTATDRATYEFGVDSPDAYTVSCTVLDVGGLTYLTISTPLP